MPVATVTPLTRPEDLVEYLSELIEKSSLPFEYVGKYQDSLVPGYPAVLVEAGPANKEIHGTHTWLLTLRAIIYVMHAEMSIDHAARTLADMELATRLIQLIEQPDLTLGQRIIAGWVESEVPGAMPPRSNKSNAVISTRLGYRATNQARF